MAEKPEDLSLPASVVARIIKDALPEGVNVSKEARTAIGKAASVFILYATACANNFALKGKRKTLNASDIFSALEDMEFEQFIPELKECLEAYKQEQKDKKEAAADRKKKQAAAAAAAAAAAQATTSSVSTPLVTSSPVSMSLVSTSSPLTSTVSTSSVLPAGLVLVPALVPQGGGQFSSQSSAAIVVSSGAGAREEAMEVDTPSSTTQTSRTDTVSSGVPPP